MISAPYWRSFYIVRLEVQKEIAELGSSKSYLWCNAWFHSGCWKMPSDDDHRQAHMTPIFVNLHQWFFNYPLFQFWLSDLFCCSTRNGKNKGNKWIPIPYYCTTKIERPFSSDVISLFLPWSHFQARYLTVSTVAGVMCVDILTQPCQIHVTLTANLTKLANNLLVV